MQSGSFVKFVRSRPTSNVVAASFEVSKIIARHGKPFSDGDYTSKNLGWNVHLNYMKIFKNKDKILQRIKDLPISRNTVKKRIIKFK